MRPVCVPCKTTMKPKENGFYVTSMAPRGPGLRDQPYEIWQGDKWGCDGCGAEVVVGFGLKPYAEVHQDGFQKELSEYKPLEVTDT